MQSHPFKVVVEGPSNVGKSSFVHYMTHGQPLLDPSRCIGCSFQCMRMKTPMGELKFEIWDIHSRETRWNPRPMKYRGASICILVIALDNPQTLEDLPKFFDEFYEQASPLAQVIMVGTKLDLIGSTPKNQPVPYDKAVQMAKKYGALGYVELSNTTGKNHECFLNILLEAATIELPSMSTRNPPSAVINTVTEAKPGLFASLLSLVSSPKAAPETKRPTSSSSASSLPINTVPSSSPARRVTPKSGGTNPSWEVLFGQEPGPAPHPCHGHVCAEHRGVLYIFGGAGVVNHTGIMRFDLKSKKWIAPLPSPTLGNFTAMVKETHHMYLFGGDTGGTPNNNLFHFNLESREWTKLYPTDEGPAATAPVPRYGASLIKYWESLFVFGGSSGDEYFRDIKKFNLNTKKWEPILLAEGSLIPPSRCHHTAFRIRNKEAIFYVFGGLSEARVKLSDLWELCPTSPLTWRQHTTTGAIPTPQRGHVGCVADNSLLMFGSSNDNPICEISRLDFDSLNWTRLSPTGQSPSAREFHAATSSRDDQIIVFGGLLRQVNSELLGDAFVLNIPTVRSLSLLALALPPYCWMHICSFLPPESIALLGMCCKGLYALCNDDEVWRALLPPSLRIGSKLKKKYVELYVRKPLWRNPSPRTVEEGLIKSYYPTSYYPVRSYSPPGCFLGNGIVQLANCTTKYVSEIVPGDFVLTESLNAREVARVLTRDVYKDYNLVFLNGLGLTTGHPVLINGKWMHPTDVATPTRLFVTKLYNFELAGGNKVPDHSVIINGLVLCTLGKDCGIELNERFPDLNNTYGIGYWSKTKTKQA
ncbi:galactose oxidase [Pelomyxa schiedti]|nr:galactose oxidase [Pelomyxa schiedti]